MSPASTGPRLLRPAGSAEFVGKSPRTTRHAKRRVRPVCVVETSTGDLPVLTLQDPSDVQLLPVSLDLSDIGLLSGLLQRRRPVWECLPMNMAYRSVGGTQMDWLSQSLGLLHYRTQEPIWRTSCRRRMVRCPLMLVSRFLVPFPAGPPTPRRIIQELVSGSVVGSMIGESIVVVAQASMSDLSREGPFDVHQDYSTSGASPRVLDSMRGCQYHMTSHDEGTGGPDFNPAYGIHLHDPRLLEYVGAPESARLLSRSPEYWLHHMGREKTLSAALQLQHDAGLIFFGDSGPPGVRDIPQPDVLGGHARSL